MVTEPSRLETVSVIHKQIGIAQPVQRSQLAQARAPPLLLLQLEKLLVRWETVGEVLLVKGQVLVNVVPNMASVGAPWIIVLVDVKHYLAYVVLEVQQHQRQV
jgi:hypothetical protein